MGHHGFGGCSHHNKNQNPEENRKKEEKRLPYIDTSLEDIENEGWIDVLGYDGIYQISNLGRVKSLGRYSGKRWIKERILKQTLSSNGNPSVKFSVDNIKKTMRIPTLVADAFLREREFGEEICHKNKIPYDNRVSNLLITTHSYSQEISYRNGNMENWGIQNIPRDEREEYENNFCIYENGILVRQICTSCMNEYPLEEFYKDSTKKYYRRICRGCQLKKLGVEDLGKLKNRIELAQAGLRYCTVCKELKVLDRDFYNSNKGYLGKSNTCKECSYKLHKDFISKRRKKVKKIPKYFLDGKEFFTLKDFALYVNKKYKVSIDAVCKRISEGKSEEDCRLSESEMRSKAYTKGRILVIDTVTDKEFIFNNTRDSKLLGMFSASTITNAIKTGEKTRITSLSKYNNPCVIKRL